MSGYRGGRNNNRRFNNQTKSDTNSDQKQNTNSNYRSRYNNNQDNRQDRQYYRRVYRPHRDRRFNDKISSEVKDQADLLVDKLISIIDKHMLDNLQEDAKKELQSTLQDEKHRFLPVILGGAFRVLNTYINRHNVISDGIKSGSVDILEKEEQPVNIFVNNDSKKNE